MYEDIGGKIKTLAKAWFFIGAIIAVICGIYLVVIDDSMVFVGLFLAVGGPLLAYISSWLLYGFGELIDIACDIEWNTRRVEPTAQEEMFSEGRIRRLEQLRSRGIITEEQFQQELTKE